MKDFLKYTLASLVGNLLGLILLTVFGIGGLAFLIVASASRDTETVLKDKSVLVFDLSLGISDTSAESTGPELLQKTLAEDTTGSIQLRLLLESLDRASQDDKIVGLYLRGASGDTPTGLANLKEVRQALQRFREAGKTIVAYDIDWTEREYYLGSVADTVVVHPMGTVEMNGLSSEIMFFAGALQKFGIGVQVTRVGEYKSAVEPFLQQQMSPENREQTRRLLEDLWREFALPIGESRNLTAEQLVEIVEQNGILLAEDAVDRQVVDRIAYDDEVAADLRELTGQEDEEKPFEQIGIRAYSRTPQVVRTAAGDSTSRNQIAVVYANGDIVDGRGLPNQIGGDRLASVLRKLRRDDQVKGVVLRVNSPGGSATASEVIGREVKLLRGEKPIVVSMGNYAASGGYWISMGADRILAEPNTITGSIGVFGLHFNVQEIANENGITWDGVKTGPFAELNSISRPKTPEELERIQAIVDLIYDRFIAGVAEFRKLPETTVAEIARGRIWSGVQARELGLVDEIGGLEDAIVAVAETAELGDDWRIEEYPKTRSFEERLLESLLVSEAGGSNSLKAELVQLYQELTVLQYLNDPRGIYTRLPFNLRME
ncbi:MAG: signal peptide peptidase SppA [Limnospira sp.]